MRQSQCCNKRGHCVFLRVWIIQDVGMSCKMHLLQTGRAFEVGIYKVCLLTLEPAKQLLPEFNTFYWCSPEKSLGHKTWTPKSLPSTTHTHAVGASRSFLGGTSLTILFPPFAPKASVLAQASSAPQMPPGAGLLTPNHFSSSKPSLLPTVLTATCLHSNPSVTSPVNEEQSSQRPVAPKLRFTNQLQKTRGVAHYKRGSRPHRTPTTWAKLGPQTIRALPETLMPTKTWVLVSLAAVRRGWTHLAVLDKPAHTGLENKN